MNEKCAIYSRPKEEKAAEHEKNREAYVKSLDMGTEPVTPLDLAERPHLHPF